MEDDETAERERRQFLLMTDRLSAFRAGSLSLGRLLADLKGLLAALEATPDRWCDQFQTEWNGLELIYAVALDHGDPIPDISVGEVEDLVSTLERMVADQAEV